MARIHMLEIKFRDIPETCSPVEVKQREIQHCLEIITGLFRCTSLMSLEQAHLHHDGLSMAKFNRIEEFNAALEMFGELGASVSDFTSSAVESLIELVLTGAVSEPPAKN